MRAWRGVGRVTPGRVREGAPLPPSYGVWGSAVRPPEANTFALKPPPPPPKVRKNCTKISCRLGSHRSRAQPVYVQSADTSPIMFQMYVSSTELTVHRKYNVISSSASGAAELQKLCNFVMKSH